MCSSFKLFCFITQSYLTILDCTHHMIFSDHSAFDMEDMECRLIAMLAVNCGKKSIKIKYPFNFFQNNYLVSTS